MKRVIKAMSSNYDQVLLTSPHGFYKLVLDKGTNLNDEEWVGLDVNSYSLADKHVVNIVLKADPHNFDKGVTKHKYRDAYVQQGSRGKANTLEDTKEVIAALVEAVDFIPQILDYINNKY